MSGDDARADSQNANDPSRGPSAVTRRGRVRGNQTRLGRAIPALTQNQSGLSGGRESAAATSPSSKPVARKPSSSLPNSGDILIAGDAIDTAEHLERDLW